MAQQIDQKVFSNYLTQHYLGACAGVRTFQAAAAARKGSPLGESLQQLCEQVEQDRQTLRTLLKTLGLSVGPLRTGLAAGAQTLGRLNPLNALRAHTRAEARIEVETLTGVIRSKRCLWDTLITLCSEEPDRSGREARLDRHELQLLSERAHQQEEDLRALLLASAPETFTRG